MLSRIFHTIGGPGQRLRPDTLWPRFTRSGRWRSSTDTPVQAHAADRRPELPVRRTPGWHRRTSAVVSASCGVETAPTTRSTTRTCCRAATRLLRPPSEAHAMLKALIASVNGLGRRRLILTRYLSNHFHYWSAANKARAPACTAAHRPDQAACGSPASASPSRARPPHRPRRGERCRESRPDCPENSMNKRFWSLSRAGARVAAPAWLARARPRLWDLVICSRRKPGPLRCRVDGVIRIDRPARVGRRWLRCGRHARGLAELRLRLAAVRRRRRLGRRHQPPCSDRSAWRSSSAHPALDPTARHVRTLAGTTAPSACLLRASSTARRRCSRARC